jgi:hypothetical protein
MLIAILLALGVTPGMILVLLLALMLVKRYKTIKHPAVFKTRVRLVEGQFPGLKAEWKKGYGAWVTNVFTLRKGLPLNIVDVLPVATIEQVRTGAADEVKGLHGAPVIAGLTLSTGARIEIAVAAEQRATGLKPWAAQAAQAAQVDGPASDAPLAPASVGEA